MNTPGGIRERTLSLAAHAASGVRLAGERPAFEQLQP